MAYTSFEELIDDASNDPKLARMRVARAKQEGTPVVSKDNSGYRKAAIAKRLSSNSGQTKTPDKVTYKSSVLKSRMNKPATEDDEADDSIVAKRKKVGY